MDVYFIRHEEQFVVYRPLRGLAFVANSAMVNLIDRHQQSTAPPESAATREALTFLRTIGFYEPDPPPPSTPTDVPATFRPTAAVCLLTSACNFRCTYCYASAGDHAATALPVELGIRAIDEVCRNAIEAGQSSFALSFHGGGEPVLAQKTLEALVAHTRSRSLPCKISLTSNGYWGQRQRAWILDHIDELSLSFDGNQTLQDRQRPLVSGKGSFAGVMDTIHELDRRAFPYGIRMTVTSWGVDQLVDAVGFLCAQTACRTIQVEPAFDHGRASGTGQTIADNARFADAFMAAYDIARECGRHLYYSGARPWAVTQRFCQAIDNALIVAPGGGLTSCYEVYGPDHPLAEQFFHGTLGADGTMTVDDNARARLQRRIGERRSLCRDCFCYWHCAGDCPPKSITPDGDGHRHFGPRCDLNRRITRELLLRQIAAAGGVWHGETAAEFRTVCEEST